MKVTLLFCLASFWILSSSQSIPPCAQSCVIGATLPPGCDASDYACICKGASYLSGLECCTFNACQGPDQKALVSFAVALCSSAGVSLNTAAPTCSSTSASGTAPVSTITGTTTQLWTTSSPIVATPTLTATPTPSSGNTIFQGFTIPVLCIIILAGFRVFII